MVLSHPIMDPGSVMGNDDVPVWSWGGGGPLKANEITGPKKKTKTSKGHKYYWGKICDKRGKILIYQCVPETNANR